VSDLPNVALVVLDTLRRDCFKQYFDWLPGERYLNAYSTSSWTVPAHASLFTGRYPRAAGTHAKDLVLSSSVETVSQRFQNGGYYTIGISANPNLCSDYHFDNGFIDFENVDPVLDDNKIQSTASIIESNLGFPPDDRPQFLFLNLMEAHQPHVLPDKDQVEPTKEFVGPISFSEFDEECFRRRYHSCCRFLSNEYRRIYERLSREYDLIITLTDHGEMLGESNIWGHQYGIHPELVESAINVDYVGDVNRFSYDESELVNFIDIHSYLESISRQEVHSPDGADYRFVQSAGIPGRYVSKMRSAGISEDVIDTLDEPLYGVSDGESYLFEGHEDYHHVGSSSFDSLKRNLIEHRDSEKFVTNGEDRDLDEETRERLSDLGYL